MLLKIKCLLSYIHTTPTFSCLVKMLAMSFLCIVKAPSYTKSSKIQNRIINQYQKRTKCIFVSTTTTKTKYFNMFITLFFISFSFLQTACFLLNNIQQQQKNNKTKYKPSLPFKNITCNTKIKINSIVNSKYIVIRLAEHPRLPLVMHPSKYHICTKKQNPGRRN